MKRLDWIEGLDLILLLDGCYRAGNGEMTGPVVGVGVGAAAAGVESE